MVSESSACKGKAHGKTVLILIMLEYGLGVARVSSLFFLTKTVLILIMLEYGLGGDFWNDELADAVVS